MSFKFQFDIEDADTDPEYQAGPAPASTDAVSAGSSRSAAPRTSSGSAPAGEEALKDSDRCYAVTLEELLDTLPPRISYSPLPLPFPTSRPLLRRDLHDARFQIASTSSAFPDLQEGHPGPSSPRRASLSPGSSSSKVDSAARQDHAGEAYVSAGAGTDLIPGLYEGGLKTWEGGVDLVQVLSGFGGASGVGEWVKGRRVLEVGCGTAMPTAYILSHLLGPPPDAAAPLAAAPGETLPSNASPSRTRFLLQDYNLPVLTLVTLPNLLLAALPFLPIEALRGEEDDVDVEAVLPDLLQPGELEITDELKLAFKAILNERGLDLEFRYGAWKGLTEEIRLASTSGDQEGEGYGLVLSAETIYAEESVDDLIDVLRSATARHEQSSAAHSADLGLEAGPGSVGASAELQVELERSLSSMRLLDDWGTTPLGQGGNVVLIAAKVLYFGVGGGLQDFTTRIERSGGWVSTVQEWTSGVGRKVVRIGW